MRRNSQVRRLVVDEPIVVSTEYDYADSFETVFPQAPLDPPEVWVRDGLADVPRWVARSTDVLGLDASKPKEHSSDAGERQELLLNTFRIARSDPEVVHLQASVSLLEIVIIGRNLPAARRITTSLRYRRPVLSRVIWAVVRFGHRYVIRRLLVRSQQLPVG